MAGGEAEGEAGFLDAGGGVGTDDEETKNGLCIVLACVR